jgi:hypothetical protein
VDESSSKACSCFRSRTKTDRGVFHQLVDRVRRVITVGDFEHRLDGCDNLAGRAPAYLRHIAFDVRAVHGRFDAVTASDDSGVTA